MSAFSYCLPNDHAALVLGATAVTMLAMTVGVGHATSGWPLSQLGRRPPGYGLWTCLWNVSKAGVWGYDSVLGSWSPPIRVGIHLSSICGLWSVACSIMFQFADTWNSCELLSKRDSIVFKDECGGSLPRSSLSMSLPVAMAGAVTVALYVLFFFVIYQCYPGVSDPGGQRDHKIQRTPQWHDQEITVRSKQKWRCAVAEDSHSVTESRFEADHHYLTGEPAGRQIWTEVPKDDDRLKAMISEKLVEQLASGGRRYEGLNPAKNPNSADRVFRAQQIRNYIARGNTPPNTTEQPPQTPSEAAKKATHFYSMLQTEDGHWAGDYGGPHFLMPGLIITWYVMGQPEQMLDHGQRELMKQYMVAHQQIDGGWGTHIESPSTMFGSTLMYVALRLLGFELDDPVIQRSRAFIINKGGATMTASWAKFYLCLLGVMHWDGHNSVPAEMWLLPNWFPFHPGRMWCHARMVYLPMGYLYGSRFVYPKAESDPLVHSLRQELYCEAYSTIVWSKTRHMVHENDNYSPLPLIMRFLQDLLAIYERWNIFKYLKKCWREPGLKFCLDYMEAEDLQTNYLDIGPVNKVLNMLSAFHAGGNNLKNPKVIKHMMRVQDYLWVAEDGMKMQGYNGSQCWDTSFAIQAIHEAGLADEFPEVSASVWKYLERSQILSTDTSLSSPAYQFEDEKYRAKYYRHVSQGGWPFSTSAHGWPISDCTGEGLKGVLCLMDSKTIVDGIKDNNLKDIGQKRLEDAVNVILTLQNEDGGWATYENNRGFGWFEQLNPSEAFGDIMIDYSYVECSMASLTGLADFSAKFPTHRTKEVAFAINRGNTFVKSIQREDGSWYGSWACCFCYGCWFGIEALVKSGESKSCPEIKKCCAFLLKQQRRNGGWGEDFTSCYDKSYAQGGMDAYGDDGSGVVNTAWALLSLSAADCRDEDAIKAIRKGVRYLMQVQLPSGDWAQEGIAGVFNRAVGITYTAYRNVFPIWALGRCVATYGDDLLMEEEE